MPDALPFFVTLYRNGANPGLADWPEDEQRARAALLLDVIEAAKAELCAIGGPIAWSPWEIDIGVADAREWLDKRASGEATETKGEGDERCSSKATTAERVPD